LEIVSRKDVQGAVSRITILRKRNVVFVVDDDLGTLKGLKRLLREHGYDSVVFSSAEEFRNHDDFESACCVILDIDLNNESGIELRHRLRAAGISLPVIYITANDSPAVRIAAIESGCIAYLTKPFRAKSLIEPIEKVAAATVSPVGHLGLAGSS
jgi:FixJ family two-component response regulator